MPVNKQPGRVNKQHPPKRILKASAVLYKVILRVEVVNLHIGAVSGIPRRVMVSIKITKLILSGSVLCSSATFSMT